MEQAPQTGSGRKSHCAALDGRTGADSQSRQTLTNLDWDVMPLGGEAQLLFAHLGDLFETASEFIVPGDKDER